MAYFEDIEQSFKTLKTGLQESFRHLKKGHKSRGALGIESDEYFARADDAVTIQYPMEQIPVPDVGRYRLFMESEDCIVCDKCARICPVDCIDIKGIKATEDLGHTSDGSKKRLHLARFDIDMAKCCYCGLCTTVCPTECLTMTKVYDYSEFDRDNFIYHFGMLSPEEAAEKEKELDLIKIAKAKAAEEKKAEEKATPAKPGLKTKPGLSLKTKGDSAATKKPALKTKKGVSLKTKSVENEGEEAARPPIKRKPGLKLKTKTDSESGGSSEPSPKPPIKKKPGLKLRTKGEKPADKTVEEKENGDDPKE